MPLTRSEALAALGLQESADADAPAIQRSFERLARRYPQPHFPERFRQLLEARDRLLDAGRGWREIIERSTLDLSWLVQHVEPPAPQVVDRRASLQRMLREGYLAERVAGGPEEPDEMPEEADSW